MVGGCWTEKGELRLSFFMVYALRGLAPARSSAARAALDFTGAESIKACTCMPHPFYTHITQTY